MVKSFVNFLLLSALTVLACGDEYESNIKFTLYNNGKSFESNFTTPPSSQGCNKAGSFSFITHGWQGSNSGWILDMISNFTAYRGGCVIFMNYSYYSDRINYFEVIGFFKPIASLVTRKLQQLNSDGVVDDNIFMFGFSFGGRIVIEAALNYGTKRISQIDCKISCEYLFQLSSLKLLLPACDMAGPGFDFVYNRDPKDAAKNVQCIHTSISAGTIIRNCHQGEANFYETRCEKLTFNFRLVDGALWEISRRRSRLASSIL